MRARMDAQKSKGKLMTAPAQRFGFRYRLALGPGTLATLMATRRQREELVGWRLGGDDNDPLVVPEVHAVYAHDIDVGRASVLGRLRAQALRVDRPESIGGVQNCVEKAPGPRVLAPQWLGLSEQAPAGAGVRIAVLDSGIDLAHPDFGGGRIAAQAAFAGSGGVQDGSADSHGTACAGIAAGPRRPFDGGCRYGIASDARLLIAKVMENNGRCSSFALEIAAVWAVRAGADILSISLGFDRGRDAPPSVLARSLSRLARRFRVLIVAAAGNGDPATQGIKQPASGRHVLAVGALDLADQPRHDSLRSDQVAQIACAAIGSNVVAPIRERDPARPIGARHFFLGTSAATPVVAGLAAVLKSWTGHGCGEWLAAEIARRCLPPAAGLESAMGHGRVRL